MTALLDRIEALERQVTDIRYELIGLRAQAEGAEAFTEPQPVAPPLPPRPRPAAPPPRRDVVEELRAAVARVDREISVADLLGAKALAWAGGIVTLLGVVFFFVLAVNRGWIGPELRVGFGGLASVALLGSGLWLRRRFGETYSSLAAVGSGIAGGYATLLAATALYGLVPPVAALAGAAAIAAAAVAISLLWSAELVAGLGLVGATVVPALLAVDGGLSRVGTAFVAIVFAAAAIVGVRLRWTTLLSVAAVASAVQAIALIGETEGHPWSVVALAAAFWALYLATGIGDQLARRAPLASLPTTFVLGSGAFALYAAYLLLGSRGQGIALLAAAVVTAGACVALLRVAGGRELATLLGALSLALGAVGVADLVSGASLTYTWAAEGALLGWVALRVRQTRFQVAAAVYTALAGGRALLFEASPDHLLDAMRHPAAGAPLVGATAAAITLAGWFMRPWEEEEMSDAGVLRPLRALVDFIRAKRSALRTAAFALAALGGLYAGALGLLALFQLSGNGVSRSFEEGHVAVSGAWALVGLAGLVLGARGRISPLRDVSACWLALVALKTISFDGTRLPHDLAADSFLVVAAALLAATLLLYLLDSRVAGLQPFAIVGAFVSLALALRGATWLAEDVLFVREGIAVAAVGLVYTVAGLVASRAPRLRELRALLWAPGLVVLAAGEAMAFSGTLLALLWTLSAVLLAALSVAASEPRLRLAAFAYAAASAGYALVEQAPPQHLLPAGEHPAAGATAVVLAALAAGLLEPERAGGDAVDEALAERAAGLRVRALWGAATLVVYAASLGILEVGEAAGGDVHTSFQHGHVGVSALWGLVGLGLLYVGLTRDRRSLRVGGFALFGLILAKIFLYDLAALSSITRALSFLAVGAVLLLGGFFYQRLGVRSERPPGIAEEL